MYGVVAEVSVLYIKGSQSQTAGHWTTYSVTTKSCCEVFSTFKISKFHEIA